MCAGFVFTGCTGIERVDVSKCEACPAATYFVASLNSCTECQQCRRGEFEAVSCSTLGNAVCSACENLSCVDGTIHTACTGSQDRDVSACTAPRPGYYVSENEEVRCTDTCGPHTTEVTACGGVNNRVCRSCAFSRCADGFVLENACSGTAAEDRSRCVACPMGTYELNDVCVACATCGQDQFVARMCAGSINTVCSACAWTPSTCGQGVNSDSAPGLIFFLILLHVACVRRTPTK